MLELTCAHVASPDRLEAELATVRRIASTMSACDDRQTLERYRMELEVELERLQWESRADAA